MMTGTPLFQKNSDTHQTMVSMGKATFGGGDIPIIAGPCSVESEDQMTAVAKTLIQIGVPCIRAGIFKPRTSPYKFQGIGHDGLDILQSIREQSDLAIVSEVLSIEHVMLASPYVDCFQVGARNMQNFELLKTLGRQEKPVLLKRGIAATLEEFLMAAEYILLEGNSQVILCERGIRSFDPQTRNVLDLGSVALLKELTHLPVIVDPSHATGKRSLVGPVSKAAIAVGADGLIIEAHPEPEKSISDADQAISLLTLQGLHRELIPIATAVGRTLPTLEEVAVPC